MFLFKVEIVAAIFYCEFCASLSLFLLAWKMKTLLTHQLFNQVFIFQANKSLISVEGLNIDRKKKSIPSIAHLVEGPII